MVGAWRKNQYVPFYYPFKLIGNSCQKYAELIFSNETDSHACNVILHWDSKAHFLDDGIL